MSLFAISFPCWRCARCRMVVEWCDAALDEEDGKLYGVYHRDCEDAA